MTVEVIKGGLLCEDCVLAIANDDFSGLDYAYDDPEDSAARQEEIMDGITAIHRAGMVPVVGEDVGFSCSGCDCCGSGDAGNRHELQLIRNK